MKKIFLILLLCVCFIFTGCSSLGGVELKQNADGSVNEAYYVPFPKNEIIQKFQSYGYSANKVISILSNVKDEYDNYFSALILEYEQNVDGEEDYTTKEKEKLKQGVSFESNLSDENILSGVKDYIVYQLNFKDSVCYKLFKKLTPELNEERVVTNENNFFTITNIVTKDPLLDRIVESSLTLGKQLINKIEDRMEREIGPLRWNNLKTALNFDECAQNFEYTYIVPTARLHSNANKIEESDGYYYHTWEIPFNNLDENGDSVVKIQYWTTTAKRWVWYVFSVAGATLLVSAVMIYGKIKSKRAVRSLESIQ